jgi:hypothetical protein
MMRTLRGLSTGDFREALPALLGDDAAGLSPSAITRLVAVWQEEYATWRKRSLGDRDYMRNIRQNLALAFVYNLLGVPIAAGVLYPSFGMLLSPMIAAAAMSLSSVSVIGNQKAFGCA